VRPGGVIVGRKKAGSIIGIMSAPGGPGGGVGDLQISRRIGEGRGGVTVGVHRSPVRIWARNGCVA